MSENLSVSICFISALFSPLPNDNDTPIVIQPYLCNRIPAVDQSPVATPQIKMHTTKLSDLVMTAATPP